MISAHHAANSTLMGSILTSLPSETRKTELPETPKIEMSFESNSSEKRINL